MTQKSNVKLLMALAIVALITLSSSVSTAETRRTLDDTSTIHGHHHGWWANFRGWIFRRYAGSTEMRTKTRYPSTYRGNYSYEPWSPRWINNGRITRVEPVKKVERKKEQRKD